jgi:hypothetical protein
MTRSRVRSLVLIIAFTLSATLAAQAQALPEVLPFNAGTKAFTGKLDSGQAIAETSVGNRIECTATQSSGGLETDTLGTYKLTLEGCVGSIFGKDEACAGPGDSKGIMLSEGSFHYVFDVLGKAETLGVAILLLPHETAFECGVFVKNIIKGDVLCLLLTPLTSSLTHLFHCNKGTNDGEQAQKTYWNDDGTAVTAQLLVEFDGGALNESNLQLLATITTKEASAIMSE